MCATKASVRETQHNIICYRCSHGLPDRPVVHRTVHVNTAVPKKRRK
jgi:hypothetical protein